MSAWSVFLGSSISHLVSEWSIVPLRFCLGPKESWRLVEPLGLALPGHTADSWRRGTALAAVPVTAGCLVQQPDGGMQAVCVDCSMTRSTTAAECW